MKAKKCNSLQLPVLYETNPSIPIRCLQKKKINLDYDGANDVNSLTALSCDSSRK